MRNNPRPQHQPRARFGIHDQIEIALPVDLLRIAQPVPLFRQRPQCLGHERGAFHAHRDFARLGFEERAFRAEDVAQIELLERGIGLVAHHVLLEVELDLPLLIENLHELALAHVADHHQPSGDGHVHRVFLAVDIGRERFRGKVGGRKIGPKRIGATGPHLGELLPAHRMLVVGDVWRKVAHGNGTWHRGGPGFPAQTDSGWIPAHPGIPGARQRFPLLPPLRTRFRANSIRRG